jgi:hypothetical protein
MNVINFFIHNLSISRLQIQTQAEERKEILECLYLKRHKQSYVNSGILSFIRHKPHPESKMQYATSFPA